LRLCICCNLRLDDLRLFGVGSAVGVGDLFGVDTAVGVDLFAALNVLRALTLADSAALNLLRALAASMSTDFGTAFVSPPT